MANLSRSNPYPVGNALLDAQHEVILSYMAKIRGYLQDGDTGRNAFELVYRLDTFCSLHFWDEEKMMEELEYPEIDEHKSEHALFLRHLEQLTGMFEELSCTQNLEELDTLRSWFLRHIKVCDGNYADYRKTTSEAGEDANRRRCVQAYGVAKTGFVTRPGFHP